MDLRINEKRRKRCETVTKSENGVKRVKPCGKTRRHAVKTREAVKPGKR